jgi:2-keto-4-pentenoate hydratase
MFDDTRIQQLATELNQAEKSRTQIEHFSKRYPDMTIEDGYRINRAWKQRCGLSTRRESNPNGDHTASHGQQEVGDHQGRYQVWFFLHYC